MGAVSRVGALSRDYGIFTLAKEPVVLATMRKGAVATFLWLMAGLSAAYAQSGTESGMYQSKGKHCLPVL